MSNSNKEDKFLGFIIIIAAIIGVMWLFDAGPFEKKSSPPLSPIYGGGYQPSFTGDNSPQRIVSVYYGSGVLAYSNVKVYDNYVIIPELSSTTKYYYQKYSGNYNYFISMDTFFLYFD